MTFDADIWLELLDSLDEPVALCDDEGAILLANHAARTLLGVKETQGVLFHLEARDTFRYRAITNAQGAREFFMADVEIQGAPCGRASLRVCPMRQGGYRVLIVPEAPLAQHAPGVRLLRALSAVSAHASLFDDPEQLLSLFSECLASAFPDWSFCLALDLPGAFAASLSRPEQPQGSVGPMPDHPCDPLPPDERRFARTLNGARVVFVSEDRRVKARLQVESSLPSALTTQEREALALFMQIFGFMARRHSRAPGRFEELAPILNQLDAIVVLCDARRGVRAWNQAFERLVGSPTPGRDVLEFFAPDAHAPLRAAAAEALVGQQPIPSTASLHLPDGQRRQLTLRVTPSLETASQRGFLIVGQSLGVDASGLERELARADHMQRMGQLATSVAHELKNPLTSILNYADYLLQKYRDQLFEQRDQERLVRIIEGVERIDRFIHDLVSLARAPHQAQLARVNLHQVVREAAALCEVTLRDHDARLTLELQAQPPCALGVESQLTQVFVNLIANAALATHADRPGRIVVRSYVEGARLWLEVQDDGVGIPLAIQAQIFEPFFTTRKGRGGSGLGLVISRTILEQHGGDVLVRSEPGQGATFRVWLPHEPGEPSAPGVEPPSQEHA